MAIIYFIILFYGAGGWVGRAGAPARLHCGAGGIPVAAKDAGADRGVAPPLRRVARPRAAAVEHAGGARRAAQLRAAAESQHGQKTKL